MTPDTWTISTRCSNNGCLSVNWHKSSYSSDSFNCVEGRQTGGMVQVRDSKDNQSPILQFAPAAWTAFIDAIVDGTIHNKPATP